MKTKRSCMLGFVVILLLLVSCENSKNDALSLLLMITHSSLDSKAITGFSFINPTATGIIDQGAKTIAVTVPYGTDVTKLVARFTTTGKMVKVGSVERASELTQNDFTNHVDYMVLAADGSTATYRVTVAVALNAAEEINAFWFANPAATGTIDQHAKTVSIVVPDGTDLIKLVAKFITTGNTVKVGSAEQTSELTPNDFTDEIDYTVIAADGSTATYRVTVTLVSIGEKLNYTADGVSFSMIYLPGGRTFPKGLDDSMTGRVPNAYMIGDTEVTYELWKKVYDWATDGARGANRYFFANPGAQGGASYGAATDHQHPVTTINWRDAMVWCNAATEWYDAMKGTAYTCVYTASGAPIRDSLSYNAVPKCDTVTPDAAATGFRLITRDEWELAARWCNDAVNTVAGYDNPWFTKGDSASGAYTSIWDDGDVNPANGTEDGKDANDLVAVYGWYWDKDLNYIDTGVESTARVKSKEQNSLALFDMSGNVWEWCFDTGPSTGNGRWHIGGSWSMNIWIWRSAATGGSKTRTVRTTTWAFALQGPNNHLDFAVMICHWV